MLLWGLPNAGEPVGGGRPRTHGKRCRKTEHYWVTRIKLMKTKNKSFWVLFWLNVNLGWVAHSFGDCTADRLGRPAQAQCYFVGNNSAPLYSKTFSYAIEHQSGPDGHVAVVYIVPQRSPLAARMSCSTYLLKNVFAFSTSQIKHNGLFEVTTF